MNETIFSLAEFHNRPELRELGQKMIHGGSGFVAYTTIGGVTSRMYYAPVPSTGWALAVIFPEAELYADVRSLTLVAAAIALVGMLLLTGAVHGVARAVTAPLGALATATEEIAAGNFDAELPPVRTHDEVGQLTLAFTAMTGALKDYIRDLTETTAAKERIQSELKVATDIQASLLPRLFPAFPDRPEFDIFATMDPAKEVGGDFYDFFFVNPANLCFLVADVADKGVPAALYMMVAKTLLKAEGQRLGEPEQILACVNNILAADNDSCMFTTVFCAILDTDSGEVRFANAGHNPPVLISAAGKARLLPVRAGFVLGPMADAVFTAERMVLQPGEALFLYTDGITEATNRTDEPYGEARLLAALQAAAEMELTEMLRAIRAEVVNHANGAPQSDDITMIAIKYRGRPEKNS
jgi:sigma-B regulation protein RsbU (phosphoserine phosphatase)